MNLLEQTRDTLVEAMKCLERIVGCDHHLFYPKSTRCDGKTTMGECCKKGICDVIFKTRKVLKLPLRNCDVGTPLEQSMRYGFFCNQHRTMEKCCAECPAFDKADCEFVWGQMPYEEGGDE